MELFKFTEEQEMLRKAVREFVESEIAPKAAEWDEKDYCPVELWPVMGELGILGIFIPEEYGGTGLGHVAVSYTHLLELKEEANRSKRISSPSPPSIH